MRYLSKKLAALIITLFIISALAFLAFQIIPGDPATAKLGTEATPLRVEALRAEMGLDRPLPVRYLSWLRDFFFGDMGTSYSYNISVRDMLANKVPVTAALSGLSFLIIIIISIPVGVLSSKNEDGIISRLVTVLNQLMMAVPPFFLGIIFTLLFGAILKIFTPGNFMSYTQDLGGFLIYMIFPALSIALPKSAMTVKLLRSSISDELGRDYVRTAYSRGNTRSSVLYRHVLRNAIIPVITLLTMTLADIVAASVVVEQVFNIPGLGRLLVSSIANRDFPVTQAIALILASLVVVLNFLTDLIYRYVDPRIKL